MVALTNPKALLFMSAFLPQFINPAAPLFAQYATLAAVLALMNVATMLAYATLGAQLVRLPRRRPALDEPRLRQPDDGPATLALIGGAP